IGAYASSIESRCARPWTTTRSAACARAAASRANRVLPMPASPAISTIPPFAITASTRASSAARPIRGTSPCSTPEGYYARGRRRVRRNLVMTSNAFYFNATGSQRHDEVCIEHNGMLAGPDTARSLAGVLELLPDEWDELFLPALDRYAFDDLGAPMFRVHVD